MKSNTQKASEQRQSAIKATRFEIYTKNPETGETGWDIENVNVYSETPKEMIKTFPNFDCIITTNDWFGKCSFVMYDLDELKAFEPK